MRATNGGWPGYGREYNHPCICVHVGVYELILWEHVEDLVILA